MKLLRMKKLLWSLLAVIIMLGCFSGCGKKSETNAGLVAPNYHALAELYWDDDFDELFRDSYHWYQSIENEEGVYIITTTYLSREILDCWEKEKVYKSIPVNPLWKFTVSPSYLKQMNIDLREEDFRDAVNGTRLYMIPDTLSESEIETMSSYLKETATYHAKDSLIQTTFTRNEDIRIITYTPSGSYFTYPSNKGEALVTDAPVIYVCTSENMKYFENESLLATGVYSYIKFENKETMERLTADPILEKYNLHFLPLAEIYKKAPWVDPGIEKVFQ